MQKHKQENAPREYTRDAPSYFAFALEKLAVFLLKLSTRNRVHSPADSLGRFTPRAHALKGVLLNSASPDACEPSGRHLYHDRYAKEHISEISSQNTVYYTPSPPQKQAARKLSQWKQDSATRNRYYRGTCKTLQIWEGQRPRCPRFAAVRATRTLPSRVLQVSL